MTYFEVVRKGSIESMVVSYAILNILQIAPKSKLEILLQSIVGFPVYVDYPGFTNSVRRTENLPRPDKACQNIGR